MIKLLCPVVSGIMISGVSLLGFISLAGSAMPDLKHAAELFYVVATAGLFLVMARSFGLAALIGLGIAIAVASELEYQVLGFCCFSGIVKDVDALSSDHLTRTILAAPLFVAWYTVIAVGAYGAARLVARGRRRRL
jgi:hypothetical protein